MGIDPLSRAAIFLDRDGVLVEEVYYPETGETEAPMRPQDVRLLPGAAAAAAVLKTCGFLLILVSNQGAAAKNKIALRSLWLAHDRFTEMLAEQGVVLDAEYYSFSHPDGTVPALSGPSLDRKPSPYNLYIAAARFDIDLTRSWMIGDRMTDVACGRAAGTKTIRIATQTGCDEAPKSARPDFIAKDLQDAATIIVARSQSPDQLNLTESSQ